MLAVQSSAEPGVVVGAAVAILLHIYYNDLFCLLPQAFLPQALVLFITTGLPITSTVLLRENGGGVCIRVHACQSPFYYKHLFYFAEQWRVASVSGCLACIDA